MNIETLTAFFMWCTIINGAMLVLWSIFAIFAPDMMYRTHSKWFAIPREKYNALIFTFLGLFKICFIVFNLVPYLALLLVG
jgi:hypothetical protein